MLAEELTRQFYGQSGLLGISGISVDMQALLASDDPHAAEAVDLFPYRAGREIGSLAPAIGGLDNLVSPPGSARTLLSYENSRQEGCVAWRRIGSERNALGDICISETDSAVEIPVIPTDEEQAVAEEVRRFRDCR